MPTAASSASATCSPGTRQPTGSGGVAGESRRGREPPTSSSSRRPEFLDRLADLVPPPRKHRHRYHGVFAPNHKLRKAVTAMAIGNIGKRCDATAGRHGGGGHATEGCCNANQKPRSHDTSRIAWAKLMARVGEEFPLKCPNCGGDIRLIALHPSRGRSARFSPTLANRSNRRRYRPRAARPPTGASSYKSTFDRDVFQASPDELPAIDIRSL
jgi:hypothetical protein